MGGMCVGESACAAVRAWTVAVRAVIVFVWFGLVATLRAFCETAMGGARGCVCVWATASTVV